MAREKRTERPVPASQIDVSALKPLTAKQMAFVDGVLAGRSAAAAYRDAYDVTNMGDATVNSEASKLRRHPDVDAWIRAGYVAHLSSGIITKDEHIRELGAIREMAKEQLDLKTAVAAEHLRGKASGFYVERSEVLVVNPAELLAQIANIDPTIAQRLAARFNVSLSGPPLIEATAEPVHQPEPSSDVTTQ